MSSTAPSMTYVHRTSTAPLLATALERLGYEIGPARVIARTVLDSFDGRLHHAGFTLDVVTSIDPPDAIRLSLAADGSTTATAVVPKVPRFADDLPIGPFRSRLAKPLEMRALLPLFSWEERAVDIIAGRGIVVATLHEPIDREIPTVIELATGTPDRTIDERLAEALRGLDAQPSGPTLVDLVASARGVDRGGHDNSPEAALDRDIAAIDGFRTVFTRLAETIDANLPGTIADIDTEFLHELRVAVRRTRSVLGLAKGVLTDTARRHYSSEFAWLARTTGTVRDLDVYILGWDDSVARLATDRISALQPVLLHLQRHRLRAFGEFVDALRSERTHELLLDWKATLPDLEPGPRADDLLRTIVAHRIRKAHRTVVDAGRTITADSPSDDLHDLRKDAKKLRYAVECFAGLFPKSDRKVFVRELKNLQDNLGRHQDAEVHSAELGVVADEMSADGADAATLLALGQLIEQLEMEKRAARVEFADRFDRFDSKRTRRTLDRLLESMT
jgi:CHAD domain-containing protein